MSAEVSRRVGRVVYWEPLVSLSPLEQLDLDRLAFRVREFTDLPECYQRLILEAEANRERWLAEHPLNVPSTPSTSTS
jgi:hypothetical protein